MSAREEHPGFVVAVEQKLWNNDGSRGSKHGFFSRWWYGSGTDMNGEPCGPVYRTGVEVTTGRHDYPADPRVFRDRADAARVVKEMLAHAYTLSVERAEVVELRWSRERWTGHDLDGHAVALLCDLCDVHAPENDGICTHRGARLCVECVQVRPYTLFSLAPTQQPLPRAGHCGFHSIWAPSLEDFEAWPARGICDVCVRRRAQDVVQIARGNDAAE